MSSEDEPETWGTKWARTLERLHARRAPALPCLDALAPVVQRMAERAAPASERFRSAKTRGPYAF